MITIDSRGCGEGKTTSAIYPKLKKHLALYQKVLIVVPSTALQDQYDDFLTDPVQVVKVNSLNSGRNDATSVIAKIKMAMERPEVYVIIITQAAFKLLEVSPIRKSTWHLIIDESIEPTNMFKYVRNQSTFDWGLCLQQADRSITSEYIPVELNPEYVDSWAETADAIQAINDTTHWHTYITPDSFEGLTENTGKYIEVYQELNPEVLRDWASIHVAAAAFETTIMCKWFEKNNINYTIKWPFARRELPIVLHTIENFDWSKARAAKYPDIANNFRTYVRNTCDDLGIEQPLAIRNNSDTGTIIGEERISHNPHGLNGYTSLTAISIESALNPTPGFKHFLSEHFGMVEDIGQGRRDISRAFSAYLFYQCIMRTAARLQGNHKEVHVFVLDNKSAIALLEFFEPLKIVDIPLIDIERINSNSKPGRPAINGQAMTPAERKRRHREKQKRTTSGNENTCMHIGHFVTHSDENPPTSAELPRWAPPLSNKEKLDKLLKSLQDGELSSKTNLVNIERK